MKNILIFKIYKKIIKILNNKMKFYSKILNLIINIYLNRFKYYHSII